MREQTHWRWGLVILAIIGLASLGCATARANGERQRVLDARTAAHVYPMDCESLLASTRQILFEQGHQIRYMGENAAMVATDWRFVNNTTLNNEEGERFSRHTIQSYPQGEQECQIIAMRYDETRRMRRNHVIERSEGRDLTLEWQLMFALDVEAAGTYQKEADAAYQRSIQED